ncbi:Coenzyme F420 hydrogenase/dehydrogenase, beta subunit C-terminal domain [Candidatus Viridilinea mediisalina]|uniref:Coenzyme F420 hydrogenase n=1 Tax=Candidatus Viridilinea mediisalina TaxID=2024553 RepID=A0A2A6RDM2_9CHLR|nr:Coenzyme F420 hydrogenase/dehydrogenase, beta subunit C-terminal domain [Candidatus Viridilinea mediisalina]PDW00547.1 coenzyme F420 hydrogenase [Candidatus Viridilinea mediisalina]
MTTTTVRPLHEIALLSQAERFKGRPKLCSDCGICGGELRPKMAQSCVFVNNKHEELELKLHGRNRRDGDELLFGISRAIHVIRMRPVNYEAQWSGVITTMGALLLEQGLVEGVICTHAAPGTRWAPLPVLARTPEEVRASAGNKPCISPNLEILDQVRASGLKRIAFIGTGCQVHALRALEDELGLERLYVIGLPCTDNTSYPDLLRFLKIASKSPDTVVHQEFMQDFRVWFRHENGTIEKVNFVDLDVSGLGGERAMFPAACMSCFDYQNGLTDLTVGYLGAPLPPEERWQWMFVRTERGEELFELLRPHLELGTYSEGGNRRPGIKAYIGMLRRPKVRPAAPIRKFVAWMQRTKGPKGLEFARSVIEQKLLRNLVFVRDLHGRLEGRIVPGYVYRALEYTAEVYEQEFERPLKR